MELLSRIDQKVSFILSSLTGKKTKENVNEEDIENLKVETNIMQEQLEIEQEILENETNKVDEILHDNQIFYTANKIVDSVLFTIGYYDGATISSREIIEDTTRYDEDDIIILKEKKDEVIKKAMEQATELKEVADITEDKIIAEIKEVLDE